MLEDLGNRGLLGATKGAGSASLRAHLKHAPDGARYPANVAHEV